MKIKLSIKKQVEIQPDVLEEKILKYLNKNFYRIVERGPGFIIFIEDEFSDRKRFRSDYHTRIGEGKLEFHSTGNKVNVRLIYLTSVIYPVLLIMLFGAAGVYTNSYLPMVCSFVFTIPIIHKIYHLNEHVFDEILDC